MTHTNTKKKYSLKASVAVAIGCEYIYFMCESSTAAHFTTPWRAPGQANELCGAAVAAEKLHFGNPRDPFRGHRLLLNTKYCLPENRTRAVTYERHCSTAKTSTRTTGSPRGTLQAQVLQYGGLIACVIQKGKSRIVH